MQQRRARYKPLVPKVGAYQVAVGPERARVFAAYLRALLRATTD